MNEGMWIAAALLWVATGYLGWHWCVNKFHGGTKYMSGFDAAMMGPCLFLGPILWMIILWEAIRDAKRSRRERNGREF